MAAERIENVMYVPVRGYADAVFGTVEQGDGYFGAVRTVISDHGGEVEVGQYIGIVDHERVVFGQQGAGVDDAAAGAEDFLLVIEFDTVRFGKLGGGLADLFRQIMGVDGDTADAGAFQVCRHHRQHGGPENGNQGFRHIFGKWPQAASETGRQDNRIHIHRLFQFMFGRKYSICGSFCKMDCRKY